MNYEAALREATGEIQGLSYAKAITYAKLEEALQQNQQLDQDKAEIQKENEDLKNKAKKYKKALEDIRSQQGFDDKNKDVTQNVAHTVIMIAINALQEQKEKEDPEQKIPQTAESWPADDKKNPEGKQKPE